MRQELINNDCSRAETRLV